eukprot:SM000343S12824  [mRNA]  locus=s343:117:4245:+ [translate_table: standard]
MYRSLKRSYAIDGLVFVDKNRGYTQRAVKRKEHNTVDLEVIKGDNGLYEAFTSDHCLVDNVELDKELSPDIPSGIDIFTAFFCMNQWDNEDWDKLESIVKSRGTTRFFRVIYLPIITLMSVVLGAPEGFLAAFSAGSDIFVGHSLDENGRYRVLKIGGYRPFCYVEGETLPPSAVVPQRVYYKRMATSADISALRPFNEQRGGYGERGNISPRKGASYSPKYDVIRYRGITEVMCEDEYSIIASFFDLIKSEDPDVITGFNIYGFDLCYIISRLQLRLKEVPDVPRSMGVRVMRVDWESNAYGHNKYDMFVIGGRLILDMFLYFKRLKLDKYSLDFISHKFLGEGKKSMPYTEMAAIFRSKNQDGIRSVAEYCIRDSELALMLFDKVDMWIDACEVARTMRCSIEEIYTRGEQMKVVSQCVKECIDRGIVLQPARAEWYDFEGAHVIEPVKGVYRRCTLLDFQSLYPSIIVAFNICPSTYVREGLENATRVGKERYGTVRDHLFRSDKTGLFPGIIKKLLQERRSVKESMSLHDKSSTTYTVLNRRQSALKVCANSVYGIMGFKNSKYFGHVGCAESVTAIGRVLLKELVAYIEQRWAFLKVIYGDTDSCMISSDSATKAEIIGAARDICKETTDRLPPPMALGFESYYESVILLSKKRYIMVDDCGIMHYKGVIKTRRDYCKYAKDTYEDTVKIIAGTEHPLEVLCKVTGYIDTRLDNLINGRFDIHDLVITKSVKDLHSYKVSQPHVVMAKRLVKLGADIPPGTRLEYVFVVTDPGSMADKMRTPEEFLGHKMRVDAAFYIEKQLMSQIDDLLGVIGIGGFIKNRRLRCTST